MVIGDRGCAVVGAGLGSTDVRADELESALDRDLAWALLRRLADRAREGRPVGRAEPVGLALAKIAEGAADAELVETAPDRSRSWVVVRPDAPRGWSWPEPPRGASAGAAATSGGALAADLGRLFDLYMPLCTGSGCARLVVGHLAESLDGRIATRSGQSQFISGPEDVDHAHRMRALFDAVVVGAHTVAQDDPLLTTRRVPGRHPTRVILDPARRLDPARAVFQDGSAPTLLVCGAERAGAGGASHHGRAEVLPVARGPGGLLPVPAVLAALRARGLGRVFVEGGGVTVSRFLAAGALDRLHIAVAPCILGSGRPAFSLPAIDQLSDAVALDCVHFDMGPDVLFDCAFAPASGSR